MYSVSEVEVSVD